MARLYKYNGAWETYQYLHDYIGFNTEPTNSVSFKSIGYDHKSWGDSDGSGYALDTNISTDIEYFRGGDHGWYDLNALASSLHAYPANAIDCQMTKDTLTSNAAMLTFSDATLVLISLNKELGWKTLEEWTESGWILTALPIVSISGNFGMDNWLDNGDQGTPTSVSPDSVVTLYIGNLTEIPSYDVTKSYGVVQWQTIAGTTAGRTEFALVNSSGNIVAKNVSSSTHSFYQAKAAVCSSRDATVVTVYDSSNNAYNAFKYSLNGTDYYYVLDGTQADWTDDLSSIGYSLTPIEETLELLLGMRSSGSGANDWISVTYSAGTVYWAGIRNAEDLSAAEEFGLQVHSNKWEGNIGGIVMDYTYSVELLDVYSDIDGESPVTKGDGWDFEAGHESGIKLIYLAITNIIGFSTSVMSYKARFTKHDSVDVTVYFNSSHTAITLWGAGVTKTLYWGYDPYLYYDNGKKYSVVGLYNDDEVLSNSVKLTTGRNTTNISYYTYLRMENVSTTAEIINRVTHAVIRIENVIEREAWFNTDKTNKTVSAVQNVYNTYGRTFNENFERVLEIVRFEDENGNTVSADVSIYSLREAAGSLLQFYRASGSATFTAAKIVYKSYPPDAQKLYLSPNKYVVSMGRLTPYALFDSDGYAVTFVSGKNHLVGVFDGNGEALDITIFQFTSNNGYLVLQTTASNYPSVYYVINRQY